MAGGAHSRAAAPRRRGGSGKAMTARVLIVDHQANLIVCLQYLLERAGLTVDSAQTGGEALRRAVDMRPDVVLLDLHLPDEDGYAVYEGLRDMLGEDVAIIVVTAGSREVDRDKALALGAAEYFAKPYDPAAVVRRIQALACAAGV